MHPTAAVLLFVTEMNNLTERMPYPGASPYLLVVQVLAEADGGCEGEGRWEGRCGGAGICVYLRGGRRRTGWKYERGLEDYIQASSFRLLLHTYIILVGQTK